LSDTDEDEAEFEDDFDDLLVDNKARDMGNKDERVRKRDDDRTFKPWRPNMNNDEQSDLNADAVRIFAFESDTSVTHHSQVRYF
jgi:hypothetical protein